MSSSGDAVPSQSESAFATNMRQLKRSYTGQLSAENRCEGLDFAGFKKMVTGQLRLTRASDDQIREWFEVCDRNGNGKVEADEFFRFSLKCAHQTARSVDERGKGVGQVLINTFDKSGDGKFDKKEFMSMARTLGFGEDADELWSSFDHNKSGRVDITEIVSSVQGTGTHGGPRTADSLRSERDFVAAMSMNAALLRQEANAMGAQLVMGGQGVDVDTAMRLARDFQRSGGEDDAADDEGLKAAVEVPLRASKLMFASGLLAAGLLAAGLLATILAMLPRLPLPPCVLIPPGLLLRACGWS